MEPGRQDDGAVAEGAAGQGVGHPGLDLILAARAPVAVDGVLGDVGREAVGDVLGEVGASPPVAFEAAAAVRAGGE